MTGPDSSTSLFWNCLTLTSPSYISCEIMGKQPNVVGASLLNCFEKIISELSTLEKLNEEGAIVSRLVYRYKRKLRNDKGFKSLQKINHLLHNYLQMKFLSVIEELRNCIYEINGPSKQMLEWCLVEILRFSSLFHKISIVCMDGGRYLKDRFTTGDFWSAAILCYAAVSRVWSLSQNLVKSSSSWYEELKAYLPYLGSAGQPWLPDHFKLPQNVPEWLQFPTYLDKESISTRSQLNTGLLVDDGKPESSLLLTCDVFQLNEDFGESVSRETGEVILKEDFGLKKKTSGEKKSDHLKKSNTTPFFKTLTSKNSLIEFMCKEVILRQSKSDCITKHLSDSKWVEMKSALQKHISRMAKFKNKKDENQKLNKALKCIQFYLFHSESSNIS